MPPTKYSEEEKQAALKAYEEHGGAKAAKQTGIPASTIRKWAGKSGVQSNAIDVMANANEARRVNLANSRSLIETDSLSLAEKLLAEMHRRINEQADLIAADDLNRMFGTAVDKAIALAKLNDDHGASAARSMLDLIAEQIGVPNE
jgi:transposase-like protein